MKNNFHFSYVPFAASLLIAIAFLFLAKSPQDVTMAATAACVPSPHSGLITTDQRWCAVDNPHLIENTVSIAAGVTITIEPGVVVQAPAWPFNIGIIVQGSLESSGTATEPIIFTSTTGAPSWAGIVVDGGYANLDYSTVENACSGGNLSNITVMNSGQLDLTNSTLQKCDYGGGSGERMLKIMDSTASITNTTFTDSEQYPIYISGSSSVVTLTENVIEGNTYDRVLLGTNAMMDNDTALYPQTAMESYELEASYTVPPDVTLTLAPGVVVQAPGWPYYIGIIVQGSLESTGTATEPIIFTSTTGVPSWAGIIVDGGYANFDYSTVEYACSGSDALKSNIAVINDGHLDLTNSTLQHCDYGGGSGERMLKIMDSTASITNTTFTDSEQYPIYISGSNSVVTLTENVIEGNEYDRVLLGANAMMDNDTTLYPQTGMESYELEASYTVPPDVTLTLAPGVVVKTDDYPYYTGLFVQGHLESVGTSAEPITLTGFGGNGWRGIVVDGGSANLAHTTVAQGGWSEDMDANIAVINSGRLEVIDSLLQDCGVNANSPDLHNLHVENGTVEVSGTTFSGSGGEHIHVIGESTVLLDNCSIESAATHGIQVDGDQAFVRVTGSSILANGGDGVRNNGDATVILSGDPDRGNLIAFNQGYGANQVNASGQIIATYNYWGDPSGPTHSSNPSGIGEPVTDNVLYDPWLTESPVTHMRNDLVTAFGSNFASPGETLNLGYLVSNIFPDTLHNTIMVAQLPEEARYISSIPKGEYWEGKHQVVWKLGDLAPAEAMYFSVQIRYEWGLSGHLNTYSSGLLAAENLPNEMIDLDEYLDFQQVTVASFNELSNQELMALLAANPDLDFLYQGAVSQGFTYYGAAQLQHMSDGSDQASIPMLNRNAPGESIFLTHRLSGSQRLHIFPQSLEGDLSSASFLYDLPTGYLELREPVVLDRDRIFVLEEGNNLMGCNNFGMSDCLRNCLVRHLYSHEFDETQSNHCRNCYLYGEDCSLCAMDLSVNHSSTVESSSDQCQNTCGDPDSRDIYKCENDTRECVNSHTRMITPCINCGLDPSSNYFEVSPANTRCVNGRWKPIIYPETTKLEILLAGDPNHMSGPEFMSPGQVVSYEIEFENVGAGTAYGVFVESRLPEIFDAASLNLLDNGVFFSSSRTLLWEVGELAPGTGGTVHFDVQVPADAQAGTVIIASGSVHFPSVPEITPTGDVISIIEDVVAYPQQLETMEGDPASVTLTGYTPTGNLLGFQILDNPMQGELSGSLPNILYTPADGFEGVDYFTFQANDSLNTSLPATVMIIVQSGPETVPPEVLFTSPSAGAAGVRILDTPIDSGTYLPKVMAWFSEPLDPDTVTLQTILLSNSAGEEIAGVVSFVPASNRVEFRPSQPLQPNSKYTAIMTTGVHDTAGNPLVENFEWSFTTMVTQKWIFLPLISR